MTDEDGNVLSGLKKGNFRILDNGNSQVITAFGPTEDPITIADHTASYAAEFLTGKNPPQHEMIQEDRITAANVAQFAAQCSHA